MNKLTSKSNAVIVPKNTDSTPRANRIILKGVIATSSIRPTPITVLSTALKNPIIDSHYAEHQS
jgi:hypothetical protein